MKNKILIIGVDGGTFDLILPFIERGELPHFKKWIDEGCHGKLRSTVPALTPPAWTSAFTGVNPGKHNIYDFFTLEKSSKSLKLLSAKDRKYPAFWEIASGRGIKQGLFNVPCAYPADEIDGFMVTGMATPEGKSGFGFPGKTEEIIKDEIGNYKFGANAFLLEQGKKEEFLKDIYRITDIQEKTAIRLLKEFEVDLFMYIYDEVDRVMHFFWHDYDQTHPNYSASSVYHNAILEYYKRIEEGILKFLSHFGKNSDLIIFSDHGFGPLHKDIHVNKLLADWGFLKTNAAAAELIKKPLWKRALKKIVPPATRKAIRGKIIASPLANPLGFIDFEKSRAFYASVSGRSIYILDKENYQKTAGEIKSRLENYVNEKGRRSGGQFLKRNLS